MRDSHDIYSQYLHQVEPWRHTQELIDSFDPLKDIRSAIEAVQDRISVSAKAADRFGMECFSDSLGITHTAAEMARMAGGSSVAAQAALSAEHFALEPRKMRDIGSITDLTDLRRNMPAGLISDLAIQDSPISSYDRVLAEHGLPVSMVTRAYQQERMALEDAGLKGMGSIYDVGGLDSRIAEEIRKITEENTALSAVTKLLDAERLANEEARKLGIGMFRDVGRSYLAETVKNIQSSFMRDPFLNMTSSGAAALRQQMFADVSLGSAMEQALKGFLPSLDEPMWQTEALRQAGINAQSMEELVRQFNPTMAAFEAAKASLDLRVAGLSQIDWSRFTDRYDIEPEDARTHIEEMSASIQQQSNLQDMVAVIVAHAVHLQPKIQAVVLTYVLFPLLVFLRNMWLQAPGALLGVALGAYLNATNCSTSPQEISKNTQHIARDTVRSPEILREFSLVSTGELVVRFNPRSQSPNLGTLKYGSVVHVLERRGAFSLIEWMDDKGEARLQGWVFSRYLTKFV